MITALWSVQQIFFLHWHGNKIKTSSLPNRLEELWIAAETIMLQCSKENIFCAHCVHKAYCPQKGLSLQAWFATLRPQLFKHQAVTHIERFYFFTSHVHCRLCLFVSFFQFTKVTCINVNAIKTSYYSSCAASEHLLQMYLKTVLLAIFRYISAFAI